MAENLPKENKPPISSAYFPSDNLNNCSKSCLLCGERIAPNSNFFRASRAVLEKLRQVLKTTVKHEPSFRLCKHCYRSIDTIHKRKHSVESLTTQAKRLSKAILSKKRQPGTSKEEKEEEWRRRDSSKFKSRFRLLKLIFMHELFVHVIHKH